MADTEADEHAFVIDNGSRWIKAGFAGAKTCTFVFQNVFGKVPESEGYGSRIIGDKALSKTGIVLDHPVERGLIVKWDEMEEIWRHLFQETARIDPSSYKVLLTQPVSNPRKNKEKTAQIMFEQFGVNSLFLVNQPNLALYSSGRLDGLVLDVGDGVTAAVPVVGGFSNAGAMKQLNISGRDLTEYLLKILFEEGNIIPAPQLETVYKIKETACFVSEDVTKETTVDATCELRDGHTVKMGKGAYMCPETLFQPSLLDLEKSGIHEMIRDSIAETDPNLHKTLYENIILSGASTLFRGLTERLNAELRSKAPDNLKSDVHIIAAPERNKSTFLGGSILASLDKFQPMWVSKSDYDEKGPNVVAQM